MKWYQWQSIEDFDLWHNALCLQLGYPITPVNQSTGLPDDNAQKVVRYCDARLVDGVYIAQVEDIYADGLTMIDYIPALPK